MTIAPGTRVGPYQILAPIGVGGMGEVYRAQDNRLRREVALKVVPATVAGDPERMARFEREAQVLASLSHPNIASIYGLEESNGVRALVMELVEGPTLGERIAQGTIPIKEALPIARQLADALEYAHEKGIIHRDLKPANVKLTKDGAVKVLDFGLAKVFLGDAFASDPSSSPTFTSLATQVGMIVGTAAYMSPEQAKGKSVDKRADVWAFGCVLYEMLTGQRAFRGETATDTLAAVIGAEPDWTALPANTSATLANLLRRCLEKDSKKRLRDIGDARLFLEDGADLWPAAKTPQHVPSRLHWLWASTLLLVAAATGLIAWKVKPLVEPPLRKFVLVSLAAAGDASQAAISPDGRRVAYVSNKAIWIQELDQLQPRKLIGTEGVPPAARSEITVPPRQTSSLLPFWSPDSQWVAFGADKKLWKVKADGGSPVLVAEVPEFFSLAAGGGWSRDGRIIFTTGYGPLYEVSEQGGDLRTYLGLNTKSEQDFHGVCLLPDGKSVVFFVHPKENVAGYLEAFDGRTRKIVLRQDGVIFDSPVYSSPAGLLLFRRTPSNPGIWAAPFSIDRMEITGQPFLVLAGSHTVSVSSDGTMIYSDSGDLIGIDQLVWVDRSGKVLGKIGQPQGGVHWPSLSPDGGRVAVAADEDGRNIWIHDVKRGTKSRFTFGEGVYNDPAWSPRGDYLAYAWRNSNATGIPKILVKSADGMGTEEPVADGQTPIFSPDGQRLVFVRYGDWAIQTIPVAGGKMPVSLSKKPGSFQEGPQLSPDGHYLAYYSDESGRPEIYLRSFPEGEGKWQVSNNGGMHPHWRHDGKELFFLQGESVMAVSVQTRPSLVVGLPRKLFDATLPLLPGHGYDVGADGQRFVMLMDAEEKTEKQSVTVVENWFAGFKSKATK